MFLVVRLRDEEEGIKLGTNMEGTDPKPLRRPSITFSRAALTVLLPVFLLALRLGMNHTVTACGSQGRRGLFHKSNLMN